MSRSGILRYGVVGCAHYHANFWVEGVRSEPDVVVQGVWDKDPQRAQAFADTHGIAAYGELDALLADCDVVGITSETVHHPELVERAARAGVHVVCEKPLAIDLDGCRRIVAAVEAGGIVFLPNLPKRFDPVNTALRRMVSGGMLGDLVLMRVRHGHHHGLEPDFGFQWFADPALAGGGTLFDEGIHAFDLVRWLLGDPATITARTMHTLGLRVDDTAVATVEFASGVLADISTSWSFLAGEASVELYGTQGTALLAGVDLASKDMSSTYLKTYTRRDGERRWRASDIVPGFVGGGFHAQGPLHLLQCLRTDAEPAITLADGVASVALVRTAYSAAASGQRQDYRPPEEVITRSVEVPTTAS